MRDLWLIMFLFLPLQPGTSQFHFALSCYSSSKLRFSGTPDMYLHYEPLLLPPHSLTLLSWFDSISAFTKSYLIFFLEEDRRKIVKNTQVPRFLQVAWMKFCFSCLLDWNKLEELESHCYIINECSILSRHVRDPSGIPAVETWG